MNKERERQRLSEMFSDIEVLAVNPIGHNLEIHPESETPTPEIAELEKPLPGDQNDMFVTETDPSVNLQVEGHSSDSFILHENSQTESALPKEILRDSILPLKSESQTIGEMQSTPSSNNKPVAVNGSGISGWQNVGIGTLTGTIVTGIILACTSQLDIFNDLGRFALLVWEVVCGMIGAWAANSSKSTRRDIWVGAIQWSLVPVWIALCIIFLIYLLMYTSLFG
jgi:hypothetical protein